MAKPTSGAENLKTIVLGLFGFTMLFGHTIGNNIPHWEKSTRHPDATYADAYCLPVRRKYLDVRKNIWDTGRARDAHNACIYKRVQETMEKYPEYTYWQRYYMVYDPISKVTSKVPAYRR